MDKLEAREILGGEVTRLRAQSYSQLNALNGDSQHIDTAGPSGTEYQVEIQAWWDDRKQQNLRVMVSIDDGGLRAIVPLTESFIIAPDGSFVAE
jgi:hypothetical protein